MKLNTLHTVLLTSALIVSCYIGSAQTIGLQVADNHQVLFGESTSGAGTKLMWLPAKKSFLAGEVYGMQWDIDSVGAFNGVFGSDNTVRGSYNMLNGFQNNLRGESNFNMVNGILNRVELEGSYNIITGNNINLGSEGSYNVITGQNNTVGRESTHNMAIGKDNTLGQFALYNTLNGSNNSLGPTTAYNIINGINNSLGQTASYNILNGANMSLGQFALYNTLNGVRNSVGQFVSYNTLNGEANKGTSSHETIFGRYADTTAVNNYGGTWEGDHQLFALGNGTSISDRNNAVTVLKNGNVGINIAHPQQLLTISHDTMPVLRFDRSGSGRWDAEITMDEGNMIVTGGKNGIGSALNTLMTIEAKGNVNVPGCFKSAGSNVGGTCLSDARLKSNITTLSSQLILLTRMRPVVYDWIDDTNGSDGEIGLIAQEVEQIIPDMVVTGPDGIKRIKYNISLQIRTIKAIQEQQEIIDDLQSQNQKLEERLARLEQLLLSEE